MVRSLPLRRGNNCALADSYLRGWLFRQGGDSYYCAARSRLDPPQERSRAMVPRIARPSVSVFAYVGMPALAGGRDYSGGFSSPAPRAAGRDAGERRSCVGFSSGTQSVYRQPAREPALLDSGRGRRGTHGPGAQRLFSRSGAAGTAARENPTHRKGCAAASRTAAGMYAFEGAGTAVSRNRSGSRYFDDSRGGLRAPGRQTISKAIQ